MRRYFNRLRWAAGRLLVSSLAALCLGAAAHAQDLTWEHIGEPLTTDALDFKPDGTLYAAGSGVFALPPGETAWEVLSEHQPAFYLLVLSPDTLLVTTNETWRSTDGGQTWTSTFDYGHALLEADPAGPHAGVLLTGTADSEGHGVAYSLDRGATWTYGTGLEANFGAHNARALFELSSGRFIAACAGGLAYSDDGGRTWTRSAFWLDLGYLGWSLARTGDGRVWAGVGDTADWAVYVSADEGETWARNAVLVTPDGNNAAPRVVAVPGGAPGGGAGGDALFVVTQAAEVFHSFDGGQAWEYVGKVVDGDGVERTKAVALGPDGRLYATVTGTGPGPKPHWGVYRTAETVTVASEETPEAAEFTLWPAYPNPSAGRSTVAVVLPERADLGLAVYDVLGRRVARLHEGPLAAGAHRFSLEAQALPAGVYLVRAAVGNPGGATQALSERMTVIR